MIAQAMDPDSIPCRGSLRGPVITVVADDSPVFLKALLEILVPQPKVEILGTAPDGRLAVELVTQLRPELVILDFQPHLNGLAAAREIRHHNPSARIVVMSADRLPKLLEASREIGADGYLERGRLPAELP